MLVLGWAVGCGEDPTVNKPVAKTGPAAGGAAQGGREASKAEESRSDASAAGALGSESEAEAAAVDRAQTGLVVPFSSENGSTIGFVGSKKIGGSHEGGFRTFSGSFVLGGNSGEPTLERVTAEIDTRSIWSDDEKLTAHLKNQDFFEVDTYPTARFETTEIVPGGENGATHTLTGNLTLHGVTRSISIPATVEISGNRVTLTSEFVLNKEEFGMTFTGPGGVIRHEVLVKLNVRGEGSG
jgi:polyisoprenoid-binding protein YceI